MKEWYPNDASLLALGEDSVTGVEYIPTGKSPYFLEFRRLVQRVLAVAGRANDLRVYQDGELAVGVRAGRCYVGGGARDYAGVSGLAIAPSATTQVWMDSAGAIQSGTGGFPGDRTVYVPLAEVVADATAITGVDDRRGEAFLQVTDLGMLGISSTAVEIDQVINGVAGTVDSAALNTLTGGPLSTADSEHRHVQVMQGVDGEAYFSLINNDVGASANMGLVLSLPGRLADDTVLIVDPGSGYLTQRFDGAAYHLVGSVHVQVRHEGALTGAVSGRVAGVVAIEGVVSDVILSVGTNIESSTSTDGIDAVVKINGVAVTTTSPGLKSGDGTGFRSTSQGDGVAGIIKTDGTEDVARGDVVTVDLNRSVSGSVTQEASDVVVLVVVRAKRPE